MRMAAKTRSSCDDHACYPGRLNQVFLNLLVNANQAIEKTGAITIKTWNGPKHIHIKISDDGVGIPAQHIPRLFTPGFTTKGVGVGTGLGLSICYRIIEDHKGRIVVESEPGIGTSFEVILPKDLDESQIPT